MMIPLSTGTTEQSVNGPKGIGASIGGQPRQHLGKRPWRRDLRDHAGLGTNDPTPLRYKNQFSRGVPPGEYTINLHLFRNLQGTFPVPVDVTVRCSADNKGARNVVNTKVQLNKEGEEVTALRFRLDEQCNLTPNSVTSLYRPLRSATKS
jgi:hypothetical protein